MRVLIATQYFWPESFRVNDLALGLRERGHDVEVLTGLPNYPAGKFFPGYGWSGPFDESFDGVRVKRVPLVPRGLGKRWQLALNYASFAVTSCALGPLRAGPIDAIVAFEVSPIFIGLPAALLRRLRRVPMLFWVQDLWPESIVATGNARSKLLLAAVSAVVRFIYRRSDLILVQSQVFEPRVVAMGADQRRVRYFPNWAEAMYRPLQLGPEAAERQELPAGFRVVFAGNIGAAQSFETVLAAARLLRDRAPIQWCVFGEGNQLEAMRRLTAESGLEANVHFLGRRPMESMPRYFSLADALLVSLRKDAIFSLTIPSKLQSYLACGVPIVGSLDGEGARIVEEAGAGISAPAQDAAGLADAVLRLYHMSSAARAELGRRGRAYFETHFEREMLLDRLESWLRELARPSR